LRKENRNFIIYVSLEAVDVKLRFREPELQVPNLPPFLPISIFFVKAYPFFNAFGYLALFSKGVRTLFRK